MLQWSVYARGYLNEGTSRPHRMQVERLVPRGGRVRLILVTDKQFEKMVCMDGQRRHKPEGKIDDLVIID
jgi:CRISPR-associated endonuclease Cas2